MRGLNVLTEHACKSVVRNTLLATLYIFTRATSGPVATLKSAKCQERLKHLSGHHASGLARVEVRVRFPETSGPGRHFSCFPREHPRWRGFAPQRAAPGRAALSTQNRAGSTTSRLSSTSPSLFFLLPFYPPSQTAHHQNRARHLSLTTHLTTTGLHTMTKLTPHHVDVGTAPRPPTPSICYMHATL